MMAIEKGLLNIAHNKSHYDEKYSHVDISAIINILNNIDAYLDKATKLHISWVGMYSNNFKEQIKGKSVLELGCGDCLNAAIMAALGAKVIANDISDQSGEIIKALNLNYNFKHDIIFICDDFTKNDLDESTIDYVVGKAFLHHLTHNHEYEILKEIAKVLRQHGEARFFEPAINSKILDELRWAIPVNGRPSKWFHPKAFKKWKENDPHPERDNSSAHFKKVGKTFFNTTEIIPLGIFERFYRVLPIKGKQKEKFRIKALKGEKLLPRSLRKLGARSQLIIYKNPKNKK